MLPAYEIAASSKFMWARAIPVGEGADLAILQESTKRKITVA